MVAATGGIAPGADFLRVEGFRSIEDLGRVLQDSQAKAMRMADALLRIGVQQAVRDSSVGTRIDVTA